MTQIFFDSWQSLGRTFIITVLAYIILIIFLRASGKRTLSKMNAFDFIVTIALGSSLATVALNKNVALADGALAFFLLVFLQYIITWISVRESRFKDLITNQPILLLYKGRILKDVLRKERVTIEELQMVARKAGIEDLERIDAIVMETTGDLVVISKLNSDKAGTLENVKKPFPPEK